ncbi:hypothetical protein IEQ34_022896 [Dendrobium chrysotoxum]|uniref:Uncharacterized protein n=1 Tax=Dendrobium chrysotoxum TaxID=161865 RepID=A0AAV7FYR9_DENCH|nr:hypothetical protein IEQ34_022896 [Dendrobium chrysotoxum]
MASFIMRKPTQRLPFTKASLKTEHIDILKNRIYDKEKHENATRWLPMLSDGSHADEVAHKHGVVLILSERLHSVTSKFDQLRSIQIQDAINRAMPRRKKHSFPTAKSPEVLKSDFTELEGLELSSEPIRVQNQLLDDETLALQVGDLMHIFECLQRRSTQQLKEKVKIKVQKQFKRCWNDLGN